MDASRPTTLADIAKATDLSKSAVCAALKHRPNVPQATREKVLKAAHRLGYQPDAQLGKMMSHIRRHRQQAATCNVAWFYTGSTNSMYSLPWHAGCLKGARQRAAELGLTLDMIWIDDPAFSSKDFTRMLVSRGVEGIIMAPLRGEHKELRINWSLFTCIFLDLATPCAQHVTCDYFHNMSLAMAKAKEIGYRRPTYLCSEFQEFLSGGRFSAAFFYAQLALLKKDRLPRFDIGLRGWDACVKWIGKYKPDVLIVDRGDSLMELESRGLSIPDDVGLIHTNICSDVGDWSGIDQCHETIGAIMIENLHAHLIRGDKGLPTHINTIDLQGEWHPGKTTRSPKTQP